MTTPPPPPMGMAPKANNGKAIASMIVGIVSVAFACYWFISLPGGVVALILGVLARKEVSQGKGTNGGMALAGIILGSIGAFLGLAMLALWIIALASGDSSISYCVDNPDSFWCTGQ